MQRFLHTLLFFFICAVTQAQFSKHYTFTATSGVFTSIQGTGTHPALADPDDDYSNAIPLGFIFNYDGKNYTAIGASTNGFFRFADLTTTLPNNSFSANGLPNFIAPLWADLNIISISNLSYQTTGIAPNRIFTIEWTNVKWNSTAPAAGISFQTKLYENTNNIEFLYRQEPGGIIPAGGASIGLTGNFTGLVSAQTFICLKNSSSSPSISSTQDYYITTKPATNQVYRFSPIPTLTFAGHYLFNATSTTFNSINGIGTNPPLTFGDPDDGTFDNINIGFNFNYNGVNNSIFSISTDGYIKLETAADLAVGANMSSGGRRNIIAPLWNDLDIIAANHLSYLVTGISPNRVLTVEWNNVKWDFTAATAGISFQVKLYETSNKIEFIYRQEVGAIANPQARIGLTDNSSGGEFSFVALKDPSASPTLTSYTFDHPVITTKPATGQMYTFTPHAKMLFQNRYLFSASNTSFTSIQTTGTHPGAFNGGNPFNGYVNNLPIGFPFVYEDQVFTQLHASTNGFLKLGAALANGNPSSFLSTPGSLNYVLAPLLGTLDMTSINNLTYATTGVQPDRVFTFEWTNAKWNYNAVAPVLTFQVKLYENESKVQFLYRQEASPVIQVGGGNSPFTSVGINGGTSPDQPTPQQFISLTSLTANPSTNSETEYVGTFTKPVTGQVYTFATGVTLAATITTLQAKLNGGIVDLQWQTSDEHNNKGFNVQKRDGDTWRTIGFVNGAGNSSATKDYSFTDIPKSGGTVLYRLEQVDLDGKTTLSNVVKVDLGKMIFSMEQFPNPATNRTTISYSLPNDETVSLQLFDNSGKLVRTIVNSKQTKGVYQFNIDVTKWSKGVYYYNFKAGKLKETKKLLVQ
jgi:hypothetical protein